MYIYTYIYYLYLIFKKSLIIFFTLNLNNLSVSSHSFGEFLNLALYQHCIFKTTVLKICQFYLTTVKLFLKPRDV